MIVVNVRDGEIKMTGHAGYSESGHDIVCSAVSCLFQTMVASIETLTDDAIQYNIEPGYSRMIYKDLSEKGKTLVDSFFIGVCGVAGAYPENVTIN